jgi:hypothetical protein
MDDISVCVDCSKGEEFHVTAMPTEHDTLFCQNIKLLLFLFETTPGGGEGNKNFWF